MSKNSNNTRRQQLFSFHNYQYLFIAAAVATAIAGIVHLYMPISHPRMLGNMPVATFFLASGIAQLFWVLPMIKRWGRIWYYIGIAGNVGFIVLYVITRFPGNPINVRGGDVDAVDMICELAQIAYIVITAVILIKERSIKVVDKEQLR
jgi:uncharacterized membrane protein HdeD (DUF308 family)